MAEMEPINLSIWQLIFQCRERHLKAVVFIAMDVADFSPRAHGTGAWIGVVVLDKGGGLVAKHLSSMEFLRAMENKSYR